MVWKGFPAFPAHLRMRPVSRGNSRRATCGLSSALAFPLDLGARPLCRRLRGRGCANCQSLPPPERPQGSPASSSVWREDPGLLSRPCRKRRPSAREDGGSGAASPAGTTEAPPHTVLTGDFWGSQEGCRGPSRPSGRNRGLPLRRRRGHPLPAPSGPSAPPHPPALVHSCIRPRLEGK